MSEEQDQRASWERWVQERARSVSAPTGNLALVAFQSVGAQPVDLPGLPARAWRVGDEAGLRIQPSGPGLEVAWEISSAHNDGGAPGSLTAQPGPLAQAEPIWSAVHDEVFVPKLTSQGVPLLRAGERVADVFSLDGSDYEVRIYDADSPKRAEFAGIDVYNFDPDQIFEARLESYPSSEQVPWEFTRATDTGHTKSVPGTLAVDLNGEHAEFSVFADGDALVLVFADGTTGSESYAPGRFLRFGAPKDGEN